MLGTARIQPTPNSRTQLTLTCVSPSRAGLSSPDSPNLSSTRSGPAGRMLSGASGVCWPRSVLASQCAGPLCGGGCGSALNGRLAAEAVESSLAWHVLHQPALAGQLTCVACSPPLPSICPAASPSRGLSVPSPTRPASAAPRSSGRKSRRLSKRLQVGKSVLSSRSG